MTALDVEIQRLRTALETVHRNLEAARHASREVTRLFDEAEARCTETIRQLQALHGQIRSTGPTPGPEPDGGSRQGPPSD